MYETLKTLCNSITDEKFDMSLEEIAERYQSNQQASLLALAFSKTYKLAYNISSAYWGLSDDDIGSFALETLHNSLLSFKQNGGAKFTSYYATSYKFRLRTETIALNQPKRKINCSYMVTSYDELISAGYDEAVQFESNIEVLDLIRNAPLTKNERTYCELVAIGYGSNSEIAKAMNITAMMVSHMRKNLRKKLKLLLY
jgi:hypothetical protein